MKFNVGRRWNPRTGRIGRRVWYDLKSHQTTLAPTGGGKGIGIEIPNLLRLEGVSVVSLDPTGQNYHVTHRWRSTVSEIALLDPFNLCGPDTGFNPLLSVTSYEDAAAIGECLQEVKDNAPQPIFPESAADFLSGLCWLEVCEAKAQNNRTPTLENVFGMLSGDFTAAAKRMVASKDFQLGSCGGRFTENNRTNQGVIATAMASCRWLRSEAMRKSLSAPAGKSIDWARLKRPKPLTVYAVLDADKLETVGPGWLRLVSVCALNTLYRLGKQKGLTTVFFMSEMAQLGHLKPVLSALGQGRKYGVRLAPMIWQDMGQLNRVYGENGTTTIIGNSGCTLAFAPGPMDNQTAEYLSKAAGSYSMLRRSAQDDPQGGPSRVTFSEHEGRLWPPERIRDMPELHGLVWRTNKRGGSGKAIPVYCPPYWDKRFNRDLQGRYDADPYHSPAATKSRPGRKVTGAIAAAIAVLAGIWMLTPPHAWRDAVADMQAGRAAMAACLDKLPPGRWGSLFSRCPEDRPARVSQDHRHDARR